MMKRSQANRTWLVLTAAGCAVLLTPIASRFGPERGTVLAWLACAVCLFGALVVNELFQRFQSSDSAYTLAVGGQLIRMALPLFLCGWTLVQVGSEHAKFLAVCFLIAYPAILGIETWLFVRALQQNCS